MINVHSFRRNKSQEENNKQSDANNDALTTQAVKDERDTVKGDNDDSKNTALSDACDFNFDFNYVVSIREPCSINALLNLDT